MRNKIVKFIVLDNIAMRISFDADPQIVKGELTTLNQAVARVVQVDYLLIGPLISEGNTPKNVPNIPSRLQISN